MKRLISVLLPMLFLCTVAIAEQSSAPWVIQDDSGNESYLDSNGNLVIANCVTAAGYTATGTITIGDLSVTNDLTVGNDATISGDIIMDNDETIDNATDGDVRVTFDEPTAQLGELVLETDTVTTNMSDNDQFSIRVKAYDDDTNKVDWAWLDFVLTDVSDDSRDSKFVFRTLVAGATTDTFTAEGTTLTAGTFAGAHTGDGSGLTNIDAGDITASTVLTAVDISAGTNMDMDNAASGTLVVGRGGSGATSLTDHSVIVGSGTAALTALTVGATQEVLCGVSGADPDFRALNDDDIPDDISVDGFVVAGTKWIVQGWTNTLSSGTHTHTFAEAFSAAPVAVVVSGCADLQNGIGTNYIYSAASSWSTTQCVVTASSDIEYTGIAIGAE